ncbi:endopeptidase La [Rickettsiales bacterium]|nr:endopeptidase La [Rickettsiales bacterium]
MVEKVINTYSLLPLRDIVVFPGVIAPLFVGRSKSISALENVIKRSEKIFLVTQKDASVDDPQMDDLYKIGVVANVLQLLKLPDGTVKVLVEGQQRARVRGFKNKGEFFCVDVEHIDEDEEDTSDIRALIRAVHTQFAKYTKLNKKIAPEVTTSVGQIKSAHKLADTIASHLSLEISDKQDLLEIEDVVLRLEQVFTIMEAEIEVLNAEKKIRTRVKGQMEKTQREYYLNEQLKAIHKELDETGESGKDEITLLEERASKVKLSKEAKDKVKAELKKLKSMAPMSAEAAVIRNYLDWILCLPWATRSRVNKDLSKAQDVLDQDHYGLEKVKERILEYLAVQQRVNKIRGPILCLVGPPGVGKTSLAKSIARAVGRKFAKISLGGMRDESEIRGHRKTYIGSMPGKIIQSMKKVKASNSLILLDEIDKMGVDFRGDPASALLEVLDPEQNCNFNDHYLEVDYDLSDVMFVATSNSMDIPAALLDRMEVIRISGYTEDEKVGISKQHLISKQIRNSGLKKSEWSISDDALRELIRSYTREAGVRNLERELAKLARKAVKEILLGKKKKIAVTKKNIADYAGVSRYNFGETSDKDLVGVVNGLAYTQVGGDTLTIEAVLLPGKGQIKTTGKLGEVMQESAQAAFSFIRSRSHAYGIEQKRIKEHDIHIHVPEGATPKDGPSAGVAMCTAIVSVLARNPVSKTVAMTGEITLRGRVLPIGGLKEKLLAALRAGIKTVLIPQENKKDMEEIPLNVKEGLEFIYVSQVDEVLKAALIKELSPLDDEWDKESLSSVPDVVSSKGDDSSLNDVVTH